MTSLRRVGRVERDAASMLQLAAPLPGKFDYAAGFQPLPIPTGKSPYRLALGSVNVVDPTERLVWQTCGDTGGIADPNPQKRVVAALEADMKRNGAQFLYLLGDVIYYNGDDNQYFPQFYEPYDSYGASIFAIPGNHDGDPSPGTTSLNGFVTNFCAASPHITADAGDSHRDAMDQPNPYWTLTANLVTIVGLYTNVPEGGVVQPDQAAWLAGELTAAPTDRALVLTLHHPPYSGDTSHGGSRAMGTLIDNAAAKAGRWPDLILSGHVHDYQRFTRATAGRQIPYVVAGAGGYHNLYHVGTHPRLPWKIPNTDVTMNAVYDTGWGFLTMTATKTTLSGIYTGVDKTGRTRKIDSFSVDLAKHAVV